MAPYEGPYPAEWSGTAQIFLMSHRGLTGRAHNTSLLVPHVAKPRLERLQPLLGLGLGRAVDPLRALQRIEHSAVDGVHIQFRVVFADLVEQSHATTSVPGVVYQLDGSAYLQSKSTSEVGEVSVFACTTHTKIRLPNMNAHISPEALLRHVYRPSICPIPQRATHRAPVSPKDGGEFTCSGTDHISSFEIDI